MTCVYELRYFLDAFLKREKNGGSKQIFTALFTKLLLECGFVFEINTWIDRSHVGPREDSFRSANEQRKRPRVSEQVCMNEKKSKQDNFNLNPVR